MHAIVLAGGIDDQFALRHGYKNKAFLPINDLPMISYVVDALSKCSHIQKIVVVGPLEELTRLSWDENVLLLPECGDAIDNVLTATAELPQDSKILVCTSDIPMITVEALNALFEAVEARDADIYYPIIERENCEDRFPGVKRTYAKLKDGSYTGGNVFIFKPATMLHLAPLFKKLVADRKNPVKMALAFGLPGVSFVARLALGKLTVAELEHGISKLLDIKGVAIFCSYPEVGTDVDKESDLELVRRVLAGD